MELTESDFLVCALVNRELQAYTENLSNVKLRDALRNVLAISRIGNRHIQAEKPWDIVKGTPAEK